MSSFNGTRPQQYGSACSRCDRKDRENADLAARVKQLDAALREIAELLRQAGNLSACTIQRPDDMAKLIEHTERVARKAIE